MELPVQKRLKLAEVIIKGRYVGLDVEDSGVQIPIFRNKGGPL